MNNSHTYGFKYNPFFTTFRIRRLCCSNTLRVCIRVIDPKVQTTVNFVCMNSCDTVGIIIAALASDNYPECCRLLFWLRSSHSVQTRLNMYLFSLFTECFTWISHALSIYRRDNVPQLLDFTEKLI